jgi:pilus assembly protein CpaB
MARRSVLLTVAIVIALLGTALIVLYVQGIDKRATEGQELVEVLAATDTIDPGESVAAAMEAGKFEKRQVRRDDMVEGALSSTGSISDLVSLGTIYAGEQVIARKFGTLSDTEGLIIPDDKMAMSVELTDFERVAGFVNPGSEVAIFGTTVESINLAVGAPTDTGTLPLSPRFKAPTTRVILPRVTVIGVGTTSVSSRTVTTDEGDQVTESVPRTILTVAVTQAQAEKLILADRKLDVTVALLGTDTDSTDKEGAYPYDILPEVYKGAVG